jgi:precorrin-6A/cobalt-precorrin-6A reductase
MPRTILLLAGSSESPKIAEAVTGQGDTLSVVFPQAPRADGLDQMVGHILDFADVQVLKRRVADMDMVVDATHGFEAKATAAGFAAANEMDVPFVTLTRPGWSITEHSRWRAAADMSAATAMVDGKRVFAATGWDSLVHAARFRGDRLFLRQKTRHQRKVPYPFVELVFGDAPYSIAGEVDLFNRLRVDTIVCRNLGGDASRPKLEAAKILDLEVILIDRPTVPAGACMVENLQGVLDWISKQ